MISHSINLKQLEAFCSVLDHGTFRAAATQLHTTQPNISGRIAAMETALDVSVMVRDAGSVRLTEAGKRLLPHARAVLSAAAQFVEEAGRRDLIAGRLRIGVTELVAVTWAQDLLRAIRSAYPGIGVDLTVGLSRDIERDLTAGALDLAIQNTPQAEASALGESPYCWVATPDVAHALPDPAGLPDFLAATVLIHARSTAAVAEFEAECTARDLRAQEIVQSSSLSSTLQMANGGMGVALLPHALVAEALSDGDLVALRGDWLPAPLRFYACYDAARAVPVTLAAAGLSADLAHAHPDFVTN